MYYTEYTFKPVTMHWHTSTRTDVFRFATTGSTNKSVDGILMAFVGFPLPSDYCRADWVFTAFGFTAFRGSKAIKQPFAG